MTAKCIPWVSIQGAHTLAGTGLLYERLQIVNGNLLRRFILITLAGISQKSDNRLRLRGTFTLDFGVTVVETDFVCLRDLGCVHESLHQALQRDVGSHGRRGDVYIQRFRYPRWALCHSQKLPEL